MHRGRGYPQVLDRMLSPDFDPPYFAPLRVDMGFTFQVFPLPQAPVTLTSMNAELDYTTIGIRWTRTFTYFLTTWTAFVLQQVNVIRPGVTMYYGVYPGTFALYAYAQKEFPEPGAGWSLSWPFVAAWPVHTVDPIVQFIPLSLRHHPYY